MSIPPVIATLRAEMAKAMVDSSIVSEERSIRAPADKTTSRLFESASFPEPIQPLREIRATGFDAIVQMTDEAMLSALRLSLGSSRMIEVSTPPDLETTLIRELTDSIAAQRINAEIFSATFPIRHVEVELESSGFQLTLSPSFVQVSHGNSPTASIFFSASLKLLAIETDASYESRYDEDSWRRLGLSSTPSGYARMTTDIPIATTIMIASGLVNTQIEESRFKIDTSFDFSSATVSVDNPGSSVWETVIKDIAMPLIRGFGSQPMLPSICLFGDPPSTPVPDATRFIVTLLGIPSNKLGSLLSFCIETVAGTSAPDTSLVGAFTGGGNFAFFATAPVILGTVLSRWESLPQRELERNVTMIIDRDGIRKEASARIRYNLGEAHSASMSYGSEFISDNIVVSATFISQALSARLGGADISGDLGDLASPHESREIFQLFADHSPVQQTDEPIDNWLLVIGRHLLSPLLRPVGSSWSLQDDFKTKVSTPLSAMVTRGVLL